MCWPAELDVLTGPERLMEMQAVRAHHAELSRCAARSSAGLEAWHLHLMEHRNHARELREQWKAAQEQAERVK